MRSVARRRRNGQRRRKESCDERDQTADPELGSLQNAVKQMISGRYPLSNRSYHADAHLDIGKEERKASHGLGVSREEEGRQKKAN